jgi:hypothetical protein
VGGVRFKLALSVSLRKPFKFVDAYNLRTSSSACKMREGITTSVFLFQVSNMRSGFPLLAIDVLGDFIILMTPSMRGSTFMGQNHES